MLCVKMVTLELTLDEWCPAGINKRTGINDIR